MRGGCVDSHGDREIRWRVLQREGHITENDPGADPGARVVREDPLDHERVAHGDRLELVDPRAEAQRGHALGVSPVIGDPRLLPGVGHRGVVAEADPLLLGFRDGFRFGVGGRFGFTGDGLQPPGCVGLRGWLLRDRRERPFVLRRRVPVIVTGACSGVHHKVPDRCHSRALFFFPRVMCHSIGGGFSLRALEINPLFPEEVHGIVTGEVQTGIPARGDLAPV
uniref:ORF45 n=1 Tax=Latid herpesvirus 1 TaxID=3096545 RepID=A0AB33V993_9VIRU